VTALAAIGLILGSLSLLNHVAGLVMIYMGFMRPARMPWPVLDSSISASLAIVLIGSCIGCLRLTPSARRRIRLWATVYLGWLVVCGVALLTWAAPAANPRLNSQSAAVAHMVTAVVGLIVLGVDLGLSDSGADPDA
jgi:hypothetical protein